MQQQYSQVPDYLVPTMLEDEGDPLLKLLLYGYPGAGKTATAASAQEHAALDAPVILNFEGGLLSVRRRRRIQKIDIRDVAHIEELFWLLSEQNPVFNGINTVIFDSGSEMQNLDLEQIVQRETQKEWNQKRDPDKLKRSIDDIWQEDYGESASRLGRVFRWYRDLPLNIVMTALPREDKTPDGRVWRVRPAFTPKLATQVEGYFDLVWYLYADESTGDRFILTEKSGVYVAKTRAANLRENLRKEFNFVIPLGDGSENSHPNLADVYQWICDCESPDWVPANFLNREEVATDENLEDASYVEEESESAEDNDGSEEFNPDAQTDEEAAAEAEVPNQNPRPAPRATNRRR